MMPDAHRVLDVPRVHLEIAAPRDDGRPTTRRPRGRVDEWPRGRTNRGAQT
jgi:hypothetical protein